MCEGLLASHSNSHHHSAASREAQLSELWQPQEQECSPVEGLLWPPHTAATATPPQDHSCAAHTLKTAAGGKVASWCGQMLCAYGLCVCACTHTAAAHKQVCLCVMPLSALAPKRLLRAYVKQACCCAVWYVCCGSRLGAARLGVVCSVSCVQLSGFSSVCFSLPPRSGEVSFYGLAVWECSSTCGCNKRRMLCSRCYCILVVPVLPFSRADELHTQWPSRHSLKQS